MTRARQRLGALGESAAARLLEQQGFAIVARNHRCPRGEIDLIAEKDGLLAFVEVRTRASAAFGAPEETVDRRKQLRVVAAARDFLAARRGPPRALRFDVVAVLDEPGGPRLTHFPGAFDATGA